jgi:hypothetical protein
LEKPKLNSADYLNYLPTLNIWCVDFNTNFYSEKNNSNWFEEGKCSVPTPNVLEQGANVVT